MKDIIIQPDEMWQYFVEHRDELLVEEQIVASEYEYGVEICLSNQFDMPSFTVYMDDDPVYTNYAFLQEECEDVVSEIYNDYLDDIKSTMNHIVMEDDIEDDADDVDDFEIFTDDHAIALQEQQIDNALEEFLEVICDGSIRKTFSKQQFNAIKDHFCEYVARKFNKKVFRPMYLTDDFGNQFYADYPYQQMVYEDPGNPMYA